MHKLFEVRVSARFAMVAALVTLWGLALVSCTENPSPTAPEEAAAGELEATATTAKSDNSAKSPICHFQEDLGTWKLIMLPSKATSSHLAKHDDAVPGGTTSTTGATLDDQCQAVVPTSCPCFDADSLVALFDPGEPFRPLAAGFGGSGAWFHDLCGNLGAGDPSCVGKYAGDNWLAEVWFRYDSATDTSIPNCYVTNMSTSTSVINIDISWAQFDACKAEVGAARPFLLEIPLP